MSESLETKKERQRLGRKYRRLSRVESWWGKTGKGTSCLTGPAVQVRLVQHEALRVKPPAPENVILFSDQGQPEFLLRATLKGLYLKAAAL